MIRPAWLITPLLLIGLCGCSLVNGGGGVMGGGSACVSWAGFDTPQDQFDEAELVVAGRVLAQVDLVEEPDSSPFGDTRIYSFEIEQTLKGDAQVGEVIRIGSTSDGCPDTHYADGDQMENDGRVIVLARQGDDAWLTLNPFQGVLTYPGGSDLPFDIP